MIVMGNSLVSLVLPFEIVAVRVTSVVVAGRVTTPVVPTIPVLVEAQLIAVLFSPAVGRVRFCVTLAAESPDANVI
jgi:hypothetical protein